MDKEEENSDILEKYITLAISNLIIVDFDISKKKRQIFLLSMVALITFFLSEVVILMLSGESFMVISQILFFLIILFALVIPEKSTILNVFIGMIYLILIAFFSGNDYYNVVPSMVQFFVFISISIIISIIIHEIRYNEKKYYSLLENTSRGICIYDFDRDVLVEKNSVFTYDPGIFFKRIKDMFPVFYENGSKTQKIPSTFELEYESGDGERRDLLIFAENLFGKNTLFIVTDISKRIRDIENSQIISSLSSVLLRESNIGASLSFTTYAARNISDTCWVGIYLQDEGENSYRLVSSHNLPKQFEENFSRIGPEGPIGKVIEAGDSVETDTVSLGISYETEGDSEKRDVLIIPVYITNKPVGCIFVVSEEGKSFLDSSKKSLESIAHIFGSALKRIHVGDEILSVKTNLESLFESMDDLIFICDEKGKIIHVNSTVSDKLGYSSRQLEEMNIAGIHGVESFEEFERMIRSHISDKSFTLPFGLVKSNGETIPVEMKIVSGRWGDSESLYIIDRDVTLRKKQEDEIRSRDAILDAVSIIAENFLQTETWTEKINESLERIGRASGVSCACLFETKRIFSGSLDPEKIYSWTDEDSDFSFDMSLLSNLSLFSEWQILSLEKTDKADVRFMDIEKLCGDDLLTFEKLKIKTLLAVPLKTDNSFRGFLCLVDDKRRIWSATETDAVVIAGDIISSAINRTDIDEIFRHPIERSLVGVFLVRDYVLDYVNPKFAEMLGYTRDELIRKFSTLDLIHEDDRQMIIDLAKRNLSIIKDTKGQYLPDLHFEIKCIRKDGTLIDVEIYGSYMIHREKISFIGMSMDITSRKETEKALTESEALTRLIIDNIPVGIALNSIGPSVNFEYFNENFLKYYRVSAEEISSPDSFWSAVFEDPDLREEIKQLVFEDCASGDPEKMIWKNIPITRAGEETTYINARYTPIPGKNLMISTVWDVTKDLEMEEKLRESQERLANAMDMAHLVYWEYDVASDTFTFDNRFYALYGTTEELEGGKKMKSADYAERFVHPDDRYIVAEGVQKAIKATDPDYISEVEHRIIRRDGEVRHIVVRFSLVKDKSGRTIRTRGSNQDITELKIAEKKLYEMNEMLDLALKSAKLGIYDWNIKKNKLSYTDELFTMLGYTPEEYENGKISFGDIIHPGDISAKEENLKDHLEGKTPYYESEYRMRAKNGEWRWIAVRGEVVERDSSGKAIRITGTHLDITERKNAEEKITHLNKVLKAVRNVNEFIVRENDITQLIKGVSRLLIETRGYLDAWVILTDRYGSYLDSAGSGDREDIAALIKDTKAGNPPRILVDALRTNEIISLSNKIYPEGVSGEEGELLCRRLHYGENVIGVVFGLIIISIPAGLSGDKDEVALFNELANDISFAIHDILLQNERKNYDEQILKSLEEKTVLLQEVHHRVKNNLQIISGLIKMQSRSIEDPLAKESLLRCENRIMALAMVHEALYRSDNLSEINAMDHFTHLAEILVDSLAFSEYKYISIKTNIESVNLPINIAIPCSLIINEVISNSIKYAFKGKDSGEISLIFRMEGENYYLEVSDDGIGVPDDFKPEKSKSLGMKLVSRLATQQLRGNINIKTGEGTSYIFVFPKIPE